MAGLEIARRGDVVELVLPGGRDAGLTADLQGELHAAASEIESRSDDAPSETSSLLQPTRTSARTTGAKPARSRIELSLLTPPRSPACSRACDFRHTDAHGS